MAEAHSLIAEQQHDSTRSLKLILVHDGQRVRKGDVIAYLYTPPKVGGCHVHFHLMVTGRRVSSPRRSSRPRSSRISMISAAGSESTTEALRSHRAWDINSRLRRTRSERERRTGCKE
jgi:murein DD-endopeptidase MepM/ murein hydrolase activator NlpD